MIRSAKFERNFKGIWRLSTWPEVAAEEVAKALIMVAPDLKSGGGVKTP